MDIEIYCPGGSKSQSGVAVAERYPLSTILNCGKIPDVINMLDKKSDNYVIPIWNSHAGEIVAAGYVWDLIENQRIYISDVWAKPVYFCYLTKNNSTSNEYKKIGSVIVAKYQCSAFISKCDASLIEYELTNLAFDGYHKGDELDGVLVAPGQYENEEGYSFIDKNVANPNNFTSFFMFSSTRFEHSDSVGSYTLTGVKMGAFGETITDQASNFFTNLLEPITSLSKIPKLIFVFKRNSKVGLLFEGASIYLSDVLDVEDIESGEITVNENAGHLTRLYTDELNILFEDKFPELINEDFILHEGTKSLLFCCPPLGLYTHGYEDGAVEPVIRFYISKIFELWDNNILDCNDQENQFFERHVDKWRALSNSDKFIEFKVVKAV